MFARLFLMLIAIALVFGSIHAGPGLVDHHDDHDTAGLAFNHHHDSNISSAELDIAMSSDSSERDDSRDLKGDTHQHFSPTAVEVDGSKIEATAYDDRGLVFASAPAFMRSVSQKPLIEPPLA